MTDDKKLDLAWMSPPCEMVARPTTAERIRRGVEKYLAQNPTITIDGETFAVVDITIRPASGIVMTEEAFGADGTITYGPIVRALTIPELMAAQGVPLDHNAAAIEEHMKKHPPISPLPTDPVHLSDGPLTLENLNERNLVSYLEHEAVKKGTTDQRERYAAGYLPEEELLALARRELFEPFGNLDLRRWAGRNREELVRYVKHSPHQCESCRNSGTHGEGGREHCLTCGREVPDSYQYETCEVDALTSDEWKTLERIRAAAIVAGKHAWLDPAKTGGKVDVALTAHWMTCRRCTGEAVKHSAKVTIHWAGRELVREWSL